MNFDEWVNDFSQGFRDSEFTSYSKTQRRKSEYLDISMNIETDFVDLVKGANIEISFSRHVSTDVDKKDIQDKKIIIKVDLRKKHMNLVKTDSGFELSLKIDGMGNEDIVPRLNIWGQEELELLRGNLNIKMDISIPEDISLEDGNIIQEARIPLYKVLFKDEVISIDTIFDKSYNAEINSPDLINNLSFSIPDEGIKSKNGDLGKYIVKFNIESPDLSSLKDKDLDQLKNHLMSYYNK